VPRILVRAHKSPFKVASAETTLERNLIGSNTGNLVFSQATYRLLSTREAKLKTSGLARSRASEINERFDHVVIPLANAFRTGYLETLNTLSDLIEKLTIPVTVLGVGAQASVEGAYRRSDEVAGPAARFVRAVLQRSPSIGVRGEFTGEYVRALGFGGDEVDVIGCPSMFMYGPHLDVRKRVERLDRDSAIALNVSPYVPEMGPISLWHAERYPNLVYMAQNHRTLELMLWGNYPYPEQKYERLVKLGAPVSLEHPLIAQDRVRFFVDPQTWFEHLKGYDFSFGTRIHGNIASLLAGTPALVLAHDSRTQELANYHQIPHRVIGELPRNVDAADLYAAADWEPMVSAHPARWETFAAFLGRHGLNHVYAESESPDAFDAKLAATNFPPPVRTLMGSPPEDLYALQHASTMLRTEVRSLRRQLRNRQAETVGQLAQMRRAVAKRFGR
jgi:hypothetical protein